MILVTGGTGFVGQEVVAELLRLGQRVRLLVRNPEKAAHLPFARQVEFAKGDVLQPESLPAAMTGVKVVIHLVGFIIETPKISYEQGHFEATRNVLAAAQQAGVTRWIQMSAAGTRPHARSRYHLTKWRAEELVRQSGLDWTIFRPSLIYGYDERDRLLNLLKRVLTPPVDILTLYSIGLIDGGKPLVQPVSVKEVARCFALAPQTPNAVGQTFDLVGPEPMQWREMVAKISGNLGKKVVYEEFPLRLVFRSASMALYIFLVVLIGVHETAGSWISMLVFVLVMVAALIASSFIPLRYQKTLIFPIPGEPVIKASELLNRIIEKGPHPSEVLKMSVEDNIGDPRPTALVFGYEPETFEEGVRRILKK